MTEIFSEENLALHREYVRKLRLRYSILETSLPKLSGKSVEDVLRLRLARVDSNDVMRLLPEIQLHEIFFSSFSENGYPHSDLIVKRHGSVAAYLDMLYRLLRDVRYGFLVIRQNGDCSVITDYYRAFYSGSPMLAIDMCEHAYFLDYGFDRDRYICSCLSRLDIGKIKT